MFHRISGVPGIGSALWAAMVRWCVCGTSAVTTAMRTSQLPFPGKVFDQAQEDGFEDSH